MIELVALVLEDGGLAQYGKAMSKAFGYEKLPMVVFCQLYGNMLSVGGGALADINGYIKHSAFHAAHQFALGKGRALEMQASHDTIR